MHACKHEASAVLMIKKPICAALEGFDLVIKPAKWPNGNGGFHSRSS
jgi:hypothetical protein